MQPEVKAWAITEAPNVGGRKCKATLICQRCGVDYMFEFGLSTADIRYDYKSENIARDYIARAAPLLCLRCTCA